MGMNVLEHAGVQSTATSAPPAPPLHPALPSIAVTPGFADSRAYVLPTQPMNGAGMQGLHSTTPAAPQVEPEPLSSAGEAADPLMSNPEQYMPQCRDAPDNPSEYIQWLYTANIPEALVRNCLASFSPSQPIAFLCVAPVTWHLTCAQALHKVVTACLSTWR